MDKPKILPSMAGRVFLLLVALFASAWPCDSFTTSISSLALKSSGSAAGRVANVGAERSRGLLKMQWDFGRFAKVSYRPLRTHASFASPATEPPPADVYDVQRHSLPRTLGKGSDRQAAFPGAKGKRFGLVGFRQVAGKIQPFMPPASLGGWGNSK